MKILRTRGWFFVLLMVAASVRCTVWAAQTDSTRLKHLFKNPPREYSTGPLWVWNDLLTEQEIRDGLRDLAGQNVKQAWVHPRPGLMTPYLAADWFRMWKTALKEAKRLDMNLWIYDENSYPSGFAGGFVPEYMPQSRGRGLVFLATNQAPQWSTNYLRVFQLDADASRNITAQLQAGNACAGTNFLIVSEVRCPNAAWNADRPYVNLLSPGVTEKFLELTLEPYRRQIGDQFGKRVPGVFTDEPNIRPFDAWPWSELLADEFEKRWSYSLLDNLPSLNLQVGDWRRVRFQYFQLLNDQFVEHWSRPYHAYCAEYGLQWTGHYWDHDWPKCLNVPDNMAMYAWHQTPAIDCLMNQYEERVDSQFGNVRMVRELSSVANQLGLKRTLCETYGAGGWDLRFEDMKRIGDWLEVLGVNLIDQHLSYVTIRGARKRDHPQSFSYHEPWWNAYHVSAQYLARLSAALSQGEQVNSVLLLEPTTTAWMYQGDDVYLKQIGKAFFELVMSLESHQIEYDIGSEDVLRRHGSVGSNGLRVGQRNYQTMIIPPFMETINGTTAKLIDGFLSAGGTVLTCGPVPGRVDGDISDRYRAWPAWPKWRYVTLDSLPGLVGNHDFVVKRQPDDKGTLFHQRRQLADGELVFLVNSSVTSRSLGVIESTLGSIESLDLYSGKAEPYPFEKKPNGVTASFNLEPSGSLLLFLSKKSLKPIAASQEMLTTIDPEGAPIIRRLSENVFTLDYVDLTVRGETKTNMYSYAANKLVWKKHDLPGDPWDSAVQFRDETISKRFPPGSGFEAGYKFTIEGSVPTNLAIVVERPDLYTITCNGQLVKSTPEHWWLDKAFGRIPIATAVRCGENVVTIKANPLTVFHELEPAYLLGHFSLRPVEHGFVIESDHGLTMRPSTDTAAKRLGWNSQGHPFYAGAVAYSEQFKVSKRAGRFAVALPEWYGSVSEVAINGKFAGYIDAPPWECDVTKWTKSGENSVEVKVFGTLKNTLGPHHGNPVLGAAWPNRFQVGPEGGPPAGTNYSTVAYGLFRPFVLKQRTVAAKGAEKDLVAIFTVQR